MQLHQMFREGQTEPRPLVVLGRGGVELNEVLEEAGQVLRGDPGPRVRGRPGSDEQTLRAHRRPMLALAAPPGNEQAGRTRPRGPPSLHPRQCVRR